MLLQKMDKGILCAIDFSSPSKNAVRWSVELAIDLRVPLTFLYAYRLQKLLNNQAVEFKKQVEADAFQNFLKIEKEFLLDRGIHYDFRSEVGFITDRVKDHLNKNKVNFLVVDQNMSTLNKASFDELLKEANIPLVIVP